MNYQEFIDAVKGHIAQVFGADYRINLQTIEKNNGIQYEGLIIARPGYNISPMIYLNPYYHRYLDGVSLTDICNDITQVYHKNLPSSNMDVSFFFDFDKVRPLIIPKLVNYEKNRSLLSDIPHIRFLDLAIIFQCLLNSSPEEYATILIHNHHAEYWHVTIEELHQAALKNGPLLLPDHMNNLQDILHHYKKENSIPVSNLKTDFSNPSDAPSMYVLTNPCRINGAAVILYEGLLLQISKNFHQNLVVLPSSVHEVILVPVSENAPERLIFFQDMVREVNETQVMDDEILSDHAYFYSLEEESLKII